MYNSCLYTYNFAIVENRTNVKYLFAMFKSTFQQTLRPCGGTFARRIPIASKPAFFGRVSSRNYATYKRFDNSHGYNWGNLLYSRNTVYAGVTLVGFYLYNLHEAPFTKRLRFIWTPYWLEKLIGDYSYKQLMYQFGGQIVPESNPVYSQISHIMNKLLATALAGIEDERQKKYLQSLDWKIHVIQAGQDQPPNAFILPNGKIFIFSTILPICKNDDGLATVLSHELSHQIAHHSGEQISKNPIYIALGILLYSLTQTSWINDLLISGLLQLPASRAMESEADHIGCELLAKSCFNLSEAVKFWNRMDQVEHRMQGIYDTSQVQEFFSTHPATTKRIADIQSWMPRLEHLKETSGCYDYQFGLFKDSARNFFRR